MWKFLVSWFVDFDEILETRETDTLWLILLLLNFNFKCIYFFSNLETD